ncbi:7-cyano-7-deazaguanine synthase QueC [Magnetococcales bacterium HHB-1]
MNKKKALVVLSGGQDSTTALFWAMDRFSKENVTALSFDYGQRHQIELLCAQMICQKLKLSWQSLPINTFSFLGGNALIDKTMDVDAQAPEEGALPNTFVPGRNIIFLSFAAAFAYNQGISHLVTGVGEADYSGYPDCRQSTMQALEKTLSLGMDYPLAIHTPLITLSKAETVRLVKKLGGLSMMIYTHTCYQGERPPCGLCPACRLRDQGFQAAGEDDPLWRLKAGGSDPLRTC